jgi:hypothetical protein
MSNPTRFNRIKSEMLYISEEKIDGITITTNPEYFGFEM